MKKSRFVSVSRLGCLAKALERKRRSEKRLFNMAELSSHGAVEGMEMEACCVTSVLRLMEKTLPPHSSAEPEPQPREVYKCQQGTKSDGAACPMGQGMGNGCAQLFA